VISALVKGGKGLDIGPVQEAVRWLAERQNKHKGDHGWGFRPGDAGRLLPTCFAVLSFLRTSTTGDQNPWKEEIEEGLRFLVRKFKRPDGSFGEGSLQASHTIFAALALGAARDCGLSSNFPLEKRAIEWLLSEPDKALRSAEETIRIDPEEGGDGDYGFHFQTEAFLLRVLGESALQEHRSTELWLRVQRSLSSNFDQNTGGFYGQRVFSWSTAAALHSIKLTERRLQEIPASPAEYPGMKIGSVIVVLAVIIIGGVIYLSMEGHFGTLHAAIFGFLMLACLLAYGRLGENTFRELVSPLVNRFSKPGKAH
jgi:hypothetical protein